MHFECSYLVPRRRFAAAPRCALGLCLGTALSLFAGCSSDDAGRNAGTGAPTAPGPTVGQPQQPPATPSGQQPPASAAGSSAPVPGTNPPGGGVTSPMAGSAAPMPGIMEPPIGNSMDPMGHEPALGECKDLHTKFPGDEYCILPPPPDKGFQLHIGPSNYDNPEAQYVLEGGREATNSFSATSGNDKEVYFYYRQFRMRPGAHHNIITAGTGGADGMGGRIGTVNALVEDSPKGGVPAPENTGVGIKLGAKTRINVSLHSINVTDAPVLREIWVNFWYRDPSEVTDPVEQMFQPAPQPPIAPGQDIVLKGTCNIQGNGRMLWMYGHRHANNVRFTTWRVRGGQRDLIYQGYDWEETLVLEYASNVKNAVPDMPVGTEGGWSGVLDMKTGDVLEWECHVINKTDGTLRFSNNTFTGEMCIVDAELVGANCGLGGLGGLGQ